jgi:hypothetical protein
VAGVGEPPASVAPAERPESRDLPALDGLVARVPAEIRHALDDLFRAKFTAVRRVLPQHLQAPPSA